MEAWRNSELPSELHKRLDATEKQLALYARDFSEFADSVVAHAALVGKQLA